MMTAETLRQTARLAAFEMSDAELESVAEEMTAILALVDQIPLSDVTCVAEKTQGETREDVPMPSLERDALLQNAPQVSNGCFVYPKRKAHDL